jgi:neutral ceramidase
VPALREQGALKGPVDHDLPVLRVSGEADGKPLAIVFGYACHATTTSLYEWSGDWPGVAAMDVEKAHPGATAMCWIGCGGDQNPLPRRTYERLNEYGRHAASAVEKALTSGTSTAVAPSASLALSYGEIDLPFAALPTKAQLEANAESGNKFEANRARILLARLERDGRLSPHYPYPVQVWQLGPGLTWVFLGGEVVVDYSLRLKKELGPDRTWVAAYANDVMAYIPSLRVLNEGRYEGAESMVYYALPTTWAPQVEEMIVKEVHRQVAETRKEAQ